MTALRNDSPRGGEGQEAPDPAKARWSAVEMLLAQVVDEVRNLRWVYVQANSERGKRIRPPEPLRRPGTEPSRKGLGLRDAMRLDPRLRLTAEKSRAMTAEDLADYADALMDDDGRLTLKDAMAQMHVGADKAREAIAIAMERRQALR